MEIQCVNIELVNDTILELDETFTVYLEVANNTDILLVNRTATIIIANNDSKYKS